jgi:hypothetical protein
MEELLVYLSLYFIGKWLLFAHQLFLELFQEKFGRASPLSDLHPAAYQKQIVSSNVSYLYFSSINSFWVSCGAPQEFGDFFRGTLGRPIASAVNNESLFRHIHSHLTQEGFLPKPMACA